MDVQRRRAIAVAIAASLFSSVLIFSSNTQARTGISGSPAQDQQSRKKQYNRVTPILQMASQSALGRSHEEGTVAVGSRTTSRSLGRVNAASMQGSSLLRLGAKSTAITTQSLGTGGGDINETEPNNPVAQSVSLPVNIFGRIGAPRDVDFFSFQAFGGQQITIEAFAARFAGSILVADIAVFDAAGQLLDSRVGGENDDPFLRYTPDHDQLLIAGIADADDLGGASFNYLLNITRGVDVDEAEPNGTTAQAVPSIPATIFGEIDRRSDVDLYSFTAEAGQTVIVDVDAEVLASNLDSVISLSDPSTGVEYFFNDQEDGDDSRFNIVLPFSGRYVIGIAAFDSDSRGFYRMNVSLAPPDGAPLITSVTQISKKLVEITGVGFTQGSTVEANGSERTTTFVSATVLRGKVKAKHGTIVTVANSPDGRRSNPLVLP